MPMHATNANFPSASAGTQVSAPETQAFDRWLHDRLGRLYDAVLQEPLPASLRAVLEQTRK